MAIEDFELYDTLYSLLAADRLGEAEVAGAAGGNVRRLVQFRGQLGDSNSEIRGAIERAVAELLKVQGETMLTKPTTPTTTLRKDLYVEYGSDVYRAYQQLLIPHAVHCRDELTWTSSQQVLRVRVDRVLWFYDESRQVCYAHQVEPKYPRGSATDALRKYGFTIQEDPAKARAAAKKASAKKTLAKKAPVKRSQYR